MLLHRAMRTLRTCFGKSTGTVWERPEGSLPHFSIRSAHPLASPTKTKESERSKTNRKSIRLSRHQFWCWSVTQRITLNQIRRIALFRSLALSLIAVPATSIELRSDETWCQFPRVVVVFDYSSTNLEPLKFSRWSVRWNDVDDPPPPLAPTPPLSHMFSHEKPRQ